MKYFIISFTAFTVTHTWYNKLQQQQQEEYQEDENWNNNSLTCIYAYKLPFHLQEIFCPPPPPPRLKARTSLDKILLTFLLK